MSPDTPESAFDKVLKGLEGASAIVSIVIPGVNLITGAIAAFKALRTNADGSVEYVVILTTGKENLAVADAYANVTLDVVNAELARQGKATIPK